MTLSVNMADEIRDAKQNNIYCDAKARKQTDLVHALAL
jgi:hypothetical protein